MKHLVAKECVNKIDLVSFTTTDLERKLFSSLSKKIRLLIMLESLFLIKLSTYSSTNTIFLKYIAFIVRIFLRYGRSYNFGKRLRVKLNERQSVGKV